VLYRPEAFQPLSPEPWDEARVRDAIGAIVAEADAAFDQDALWPAHEWDGWSTPLPLKNLYVGAAGVLWALHALRERGFAASRLDLRAAVVRTLELRRERPDLMQGVELPQPADASLLEGESGILVVLSSSFRNTGSSSDELHAFVRANRDNPADEVMWGAPGTMLAAKALHDATGEERWAEAWRESAAAVLGRRDADGLWTQRLHGGVSRGLGPIHGAVGNVRVLLDGGELLPAETRALLARETAELLERTAVREEGLASWPDSAGDPLEAADGQVRLQWDVGAPGIVATAFDLLEDELLLAGAELTWRAGAHGADKGSGICHGTAGNGYALLKAFARSQDELWLGRARRFAVHALGQAAAARHERGCGRYSLWTGDLGVALFAADCAEARTRYPILETWS
jgi:Lanthionine synthetase C-like protein